MGALFAVGPLLSDPMISIIYRATAGLKFFTFSSSPDNISLVCSGILLGLLPLLEVEAAVGPNSGTSGS